MSWRISVQQDQNIFEEHVFIFPPQLTNSNFHGTDIYLLSKMGFRGLKLLWVSVLCKAGDLGKLRQICNCGHLRVKMFLQTLLKAYVHKGHKKTVYWHSLFYFFLIIQSWNWICVISFSYLEKIFLILWVCTIFLVYYVYMKDENSPLIF